MIKFTTKGVCTIKAPSYESNNGSLLLRCKNFSADSRECKWQVSENVYFTEVIFGNRKLKWQLTINENELKVQITNLSDVDINIENVSLILDGLVESRKYLQYVHRNPVVFECGVRTIGLDGTLIKFDDDSDTVTVFVEKDTGNALLLGANSIGYAKTIFELIPETGNWDSKFTVAVRFEFNCTLKADETVAAPILLLLSGDNGLELLDKYGRAWRARFNNKRKGKIVGWNSWDYYAGAITEKDIITNAKKFKKIVGNNEGYIIIDDGWEVRWGDWNEANFHFPKGLIGLVKKIKSLGLKAGIWIAPYTVHMYSLIAREHSEALLRNEKGELVIEKYSCGPVYVLDPTHPATKKYIANIFGRLRKIGFEYFKIDFTFAIEKGRCFYDGKGLQHSLRQSVALIRKAIGKDAYLMSGCYSIESAGGFVDGARVCADIHNFWGHVKRNAIEIAGRFWTGHIWNNDPDFLIVRSKQTSSDVKFNRPFNPNPATVGWFGGRELDIDEVITWTSIIMLAGGDIILSDNLSTLNRKGYDIIRKVLDNTLSFPAYPIDLFSDERIPSIWLGETDDGYLLGVFNWSESEQSYELDPQAWNIDMQKIQAVVDIWTDTEIEVSSSGTISFTLKAHQCKVMKYVGTSH